MATKSSNENIRSQVQCEAFNILLHHTEMKGCSSRIHQYLSIKYFYVHVQQQLPDCFSSLCLKTKGEAGRRLETPWWCSVWLNAAGLSPRPSLASLVSQGTKIRFGHGLQEHCSQAAKNTLEPSSTTILKTIFRIFRCSFQYQLREDL